LVALNLNILSGLYFCPCVMQHFFFHALIQHRVELCLLTFLGTSDLWPRLGGLELENFVTTVSAHVDSSNFFLCLGWFHTRSSCALYPLLAPVTFDFDLVTLNLNLKFCSCPFSVNLYSSDSFAYLNNSETKIHKTHIDYVRT
jgi:hypothetical protein